MTTTQGLLPGDYIEYFQPVGRSGQSWTRDNVMQKHPKTGHAGVYVVARILGIRTPNIKRNESSCMLRAFVLGPVRYAYTFSQYQPLTSEARWICFLETVSTTH